MCECGLSGVTNDFPSISIKYENGISQSFIIPTFFAIFELFENDTNELNFIKTYIIPVFTSGIQSN